MKTNAWVGRWPAWVGRCAAGAVLGGAAGIGVAALVVACGGPALTPAESIDVSAHGVELGRCEALGEDAGSLDVYEACVREAGL